MSSRRDGQYRPDGIVKNGSAGWRIDWKYNDWLSD